MAKLNEHPPRETLHAYVAGEVDPAQRAALGAHLERCEVCASALVEVQAMRGLFREMAPPPVDDLSWQRMARKIESELKERAASDLRQRSPAHLRFAWALSIGGVVAATGAAMWVVLASAPPVEVPTTPAPVLATSSEPVIASGDVPFRLVLSGARVELGSHTRARVPRVESGSGLSLELLHGEVLVDARLNPGLSVLVLAPAVRVAAPGGAVRVALVGDQVHIEARSNGVEVHRPRAPSIVLGSGEGRIFGRDGEVAAVKPPVVKSSAPAEPNTTMSLAQEARSPALNRSPALRVVRALPQAPAGAAVQEPATEVEVTAPTDAVWLRWLEATAAYDRGDLEAAIAAANDVVRDGSGRVEALLAKALLCDAHLAVREPREAVAACEEVAAIDPQSEREQARHQRIADIYRTLLGDCARAVEHYDRAVVFGRASLADDQALLGRAECGLDLGRLEQVERDLAILAGRAGGLASKDRFEHLWARLRAAKSQAPHR